jgi:diaminopimelate epimerase
MMIEFTKYQGAGNDYLFIDALTEQQDWPALAKTMSDRHFGVGADGIILAAPPQSSGAPVRMRIFNADGSEGEMCGNGLRCFAKFVIERNLIAGGRVSLEVETGAGVLTVQPLWESARVVGARVNMGNPILRALDVPVVVGQTEGSVLDDMNTELVQALGMDPEEMLFDAMLRSEGMPSA